MDMSPNAAGNVKKRCLGHHPNSYSSSYVYAGNTYGEKFPPLLDYVVWPSLPHIVPLDEGSTEGGESYNAYIVESPSGSPIHETVAPEDWASRRQFQKLEHVEEMATNRLKKRDAEGKKMPHSSNQFSVLSDSAIVAWASMMGVQIPDDNFDYIDVLRELEISRNLLRDKKIESNPPPITINDGLGNDIPLVLTWDNESIDDEGPYTLV